MDALQSKAAFDQAEQHFRNNEFDAALQILNQLNRAFPGNKDVLYPMAQCMANSNRPDDARKTCDFLVQRFDHPGAKKLLTQLQSPPNLLADLGLGNLDSGPSFGAGLKNAPLESAGRFEEATPYLLSVGIFIGAYVQYFLVMSQFDTESYLEELVESIRNPVVPTSDLTPLFRLILSGFVFNYTIGCFVSYFALKTVSTLLHDDFADDMKDVALYTLFCLLLVFIPVLGWIAAIVIVRNHYELSGRKTVLLVIVWFVYKGVSTFLLELPLGLAA
ncbi:MAG TPA: tetratricopeptide repeat protein [Candidatus Hydrogenedentes bacterium]|nr:tetratricopeptide repeat protein [Candidatus Hydrogenedentota bacterium]